MSEIRVRTLRFSVLGRSRGSQGIRSSCGTLAYVGLVSRWFPTGAGIASSGSEIRSLRWPLRSRSGIIQSWLSRRWRRLSQPMHRKRPLTATHRRDSSAQPYSETRPAPSASCEHHSGDHNNGYCGRRLPKYPAVRNTRLAVLHRRAAAQASVPFGSPPCSRAVPRYAGTPTFVRSRYGVHTHKRRSPGPGHRRVQCPVSLVDRSGRQGRRREAAGCCPGLKRARDSGSGREAAAGVSVRDRSAWIGTDCRKRVWTLSVSIV